MARSLQVNSISFETKHPRGKSSSIRSGGMATINDDDERLLAEIGYEQVSQTLQQVEFKTVSDKTRNSIAISPNTQRYHMLCLS